MPHSRGLPQSKEALLKSYTTRLKDDVKSTLENFEEVAKLAKGESETQLSKMTQSEQDSMKCTSEQQILYKLENP
jgi:mediator of RNA polymerase II transcription subunit 22